MSVDEVSMAAESRPLDAQNVDNRTLCLKLRRFANVINAFSLRGYLEKKLGHALSIVDESKTRQLSILFG